MRAVVYHGPGDLRPEEIPDPDPAPGEVLLEVTAAGICGTDRHIAAGDLGVEPGTVLGHEIAGRVISPGEGVGGWKPGQRVLSYGQVTCGQCRPCRDGFEYRCRRPQVMGMNRQGGFAELVAVPASCLIPVPDAVGDDVAAIVPDAIATPYHALITIGHLAAGEVVVVVGAGGLGLQAIVLARWAGAGRIIVVDPSPAAREAAMAAGADEVMDPAAHDDPSQVLYSLSGGATLALECVGRGGTVELALQSLAPGGRLVIVGVGHDRPRLPPLLRFVAGEISVQGSFGSSIAEIEIVLRLIAEGHLDVSHAISRRVTLSGVPDVFAQPSTPGRTVIHPRE